jgi:hypothetical protein
MASSLGRLSTTLASAKGHWTHAPQQSWEFNGNTLVTSSRTQTGSLRHLQAKQRGP